MPKHRSLHSTQDFRLLQPSASTLPQTSKASFLADGPPSTASLPPAARTPQGKLPAGCGTRPGGPIPGISLTKKTVPVTKLKLYQPKPATYYHETRPSTILLEQTAPVRVGTLPGSVVGAPPTAMNAAYPASSGSFQGQLTNRPSLIGSSFDNKPTLPGMPAHHYGSGPASPAPSSPQQQNTLQRQSTYLTEEHTLEPRVPERTTAVLLSAFGTSESGSAKT